MKKILATTLAGLAAAAPALAENLEGVDRLVCATMQVQICIEYDECYSATAADLDVPEFVIIDTDKKTISTTQRNHEQRSSTIANVSSERGLILLQGFEDGRAYSFTIHEASGRMTAAVTRDGLTISAFGACTDADL